MPSVETNIEYILKVVKRISTELLSFMLRATERGAPGRAAAYGRPEGCPRPPSFIDHLLPVEGRTIIRPDQFLCA